jgi:glycosyltransferase involved in cell wall biosynthesis
VSGATTTNGRATAAIAPAGTRSATATNAAAGPRDSTPVEPTPRIVVLTRDDPTFSTGGVETFTRRLLSVFPGSEVVAYDGASGPRLLLDEARDARAVLPRLRERVAALRPAVIVANGAAAWTIRGPRARELGVPVVTVYHGTYAGFGRAIAPVARWRGFVAKSYGAWLERRAGRERAAVVAVSARVAAEAELFYGATPRIIENCATLDAATLPGSDSARARLGLPRDQRVLLFVGRAQRTKGFDLLVRLAKWRADWTILCAGVTPRPDHPTNLRALGVLSGVQLADAYAACDAVIHPSWYEGCPFALLDAIACDRPIVTTATGCFPTAGVHPFGVVLPELDAVALVTCANLVLEERSRFAPRESTAARFGFERFAKSWRALVGEVASAAAPLGARGGRDG